MIYPTDAEQALHEMTTERNALAAECERLVDAIAAERAVNVQRIAHLEREGRELLALYESALVAREKAQRMASAEAQSAADAREMLMGERAHLANAQRACADLRSDLAVARKEVEASRRLMVDALTAVVPAHAGGLT